MEEQEKQRLFEIAGKYEDCVYIEVSSVQSGSTLVYHLGDAVGIVKPGVHIGMFQDSVLYLIFNHEEIAPGETKVFTPVTHRQGLFSPDCYNGKSLFTMGEEDCSGTSENK